MAEWGKLYGSLHDDPKWRRASRTARGLWATANSWCIDHHKTNGWVPADMLATLDGTPNDAARLVAADLWHAAGHDCERCPQITDGWVFHDWPEHQRSADKVRSDQDGAAERQRRARERRASHRESQRDADVTNEGVTLLEESRGEERRETPNGVSGAAADADGFEDFWAAYPRRDDRGHALKAYRSAVRKTDPAALIKAAAAFAEQCAHEKRERRFIPLASTWLNGERWNDEHHVPGAARPPRADGPVLDYVDRW